jgi:hypothetical protein
MQSLSFQAQLLQHKMGMTIVMLPLTGLRGKPADVADLSFTGFCDNHQFEVWAATVLMINAV